MGEAVEQYQEQTKGKEKIWKPYLRLLFKAKLPWSWLILLTVLNIGDATLGLLFPQYTQKIAAGVLTNTVIFGTVIVIVSRVLSSGIIRYIGKLTMYKVDISYRSLIWNRLLRSPLQLFDEIKPNEMVSRTANDTATISSILAGIVPSVIAMVYSGVSIVTIVMGYDWRLSLGLIIYTPIYIAATWLYGKWNYRTNKQTHNKLAVLTQFLSELLVRIPLIKSFANEEKETKRGRHQLQMYYRASLKRSLVNWINTPLTSILQLVMDLFVIVFGIYLVKNGSITIDIWIGFFMYVGMYFGILETFGHMYLEIKESQGATARIAKLIQSPMEQYERAWPVDESEQALHFHDVVFGYDAARVLNKLTFTIPYGKTTAIIGPSGSGKSTILSLIQQLYAPDKGQIQFGEEKITTFHLSDWRAQFSYVAQDSPVFSGTIRENIVYGVDRAVSEFELKEAAKAANALAFILDTPAGFDTQIGEGGSNLSGGQRQRIAIARAILRNAEFLLLDEAMANLDGRSEKAVQRALDTLMANKTTIVVTHDLAVIRNADQIVLLNEGEIDAIGTHDELLAKSKLYGQFVQLLSATSAG